MTSGKNVCKGKAQLILFIPHQDAIPREASKATPASVQPPHVSGADTSKPTPSSTADHMAKDGAPLPSGFESSSSLPALVSY